jgi:diguanylate cyclase (GGDEF)-like protein
LGSQSEFATISRTSCIDSGKRPRPFIFSQYEPLEALFLLNAEASSPSLQIKLARPDRALVLIFFNVSEHPIHVPPGGLSVLFETASFLSVFLMFIGATLVKVTLAARSTLLLALFALQVGNLLDAANLFFPSASPDYWVVGDALTFSGEVLLAFVVFQFVRHTNRLANLDPLTRLFNRSYHMRRLAEFLKSGGEDSSSVAVIAIDLDHFKHINDVYGHGFGDQVLIDIAQAISVLQNKVDLISRTGGEEFEVVARGLDEPAALRLAEAIREQIAALQFEQGPKVSASLGVALSHPNEALSSLRQRADAAAYQAKQTGRNRVQLAT